MQNVKKLSILVLFMNSLIISGAHADDDGPQLSFAQQDAYSEVAKSVDMLTAWAKGEYVEHKSIFSKHPKDDAVIKATIELIEEFRQLSKKAKKAGDNNKALAYLFSAEATAHYAARMPHMLEERIEHKEHKH